MSKQDLPLALHFGADGIEQIRDRKRAYALYCAPHRENRWGADVTDSIEVYPGASFEDSMVAFHPGRDFKWDGKIALASMEWESLRRMGVGLKTNLFRGAEAFDDLETLWDLGESSRRSSARFNARTFYDVAPNLFIAQETIKLTGEIQEEEFVGLSAETLLPRIDYNTWMETYRWDRVAKVGRSHAKPVALAAMAELGTPQSADILRAPEYRPLRWFRSGASWEWYELEYYAECVANGAPRQDIVGIRLEVARDQHKQTYNDVALFGWPELGLTGLLDSPELASETVTSAYQLGTGTPEEDLALFVNNWRTMLDSTRNMAKPDTIAIGTAAYSYINTRIFKSVNTDSTRTLATMIMEQLGPLGLKDILWIQEMEFTQEQADSWEQEQGYSAALAQRFGGGVGGENVMLMFRKDKDAGRMVVGKGLANRPQETIHDRTTVSMIQSLGSFDVRQPKQFRIIKDIGPDGPGAAP